jgi:hypothetical protein
MSAEARSLPSFPDPTFWNFSAPTWDAEFRAWAAPLLKLSAEQAGIMVIIIGQLIECAWRLRRINTVLADDAKLADRDQCRAQAEAQRAFSRAQADYRRWVRETERERERRPRSGAPSDLAALAAPPPLSTLNGSEVKPQADSQQSDAAERPGPDGSTHTNNLVASEVPAAERRAAAVQAALAAQRQANGPGWQPNPAQRRAMKRLQRQR